MIYKRYTDYLYDPWLKNKYNCYKEKDINGFITAIPQILNDENRFIYANNAYECVNEKTLDKIGKRLKEIYSEVYEKNKLK